MHPDAVTRILNFLYKIGKVIIVQRFIKISFYIRVGGTLWLVDILQFIKNKRNYISFYSVDHIEHVDSFFICRGIGLGHAYIGSWNLQGIHIKTEAGRGIEQTLPQCGISPRLGPRHLVHT